MSRGGLEPRHVVSDHQSYQGEVIINRPAGSLEGSASSRGRSAGATDGDGSENRGIAGGGEHPRNR